MSRAREVPPVSTTATGSETVPLNAAETSITWTVTHNVVNPSAGHFHTGFAYESGGVALSLGNTLTSPITGTSAINATQLADLKRLRGSARASRL